MPRHPRLRLVVEKLAQGRFVYTHEAAGITFLLLHQAAKTIMGYWWIILKNLAKTQLDNYVLPGTFTGTEILLLYMAEWKRNLTIVTAATFYMIFPQRDLPTMEEAFSASESEQTDAERKSTY